MRLMTIEKRRGYYPVYAVYPFETANRRIRPPPRYVRLAVYALVDE